MAKVFLACFSPFSPRDRPFSSHSSSSNPPESPELLASLIVDLQVLRKSLEDEPISLKWCSEAMFLIKTMHSQFLLLFFEKMSQVPGSWDRVDMMEEYLKESLDLLDLCNVLKSAIAGIERRRLKADLTMRSKDDGFLAVEAMASVGRAKQENDCKVFGIQKWKEKGLSKKKMMVMIKNGELLGAAGAVQSVIAMVSLLVYCSVLEQIPIKIDEADTKVDEVNSFSSCARRLVCCFTKRFQAAQESGKEVLSEIEMVSNVIAEFQVQVSAEGMGMGNEDVLVSLETLQSRSAALKEGLELFESVVDEVFNDVIEGRKKVLGLITSKSTGLAQGY